MCDNKLGTTASGLVRSRTRYEALLNQSSLVWLEAWNSYSNWGVTIIRSSGRQPQDQSSRPNVLCWWAVTWNGLGFIVPSQRCFADGHWLGKEGDSERRGNGLNPEIEIGRKPNARISVAFLNQDYKSRRDACCVDGGRELHSTSYRCCYSTTGTKQKWSLPSPWSWLMASPSCRCSWAVLPSCLVIFREICSRETT